jgi:hypothetical protein
MSFTDIGIAAVELVQLAEILFGLLHDRLWAEGVRKFQIP